MVALYCHSTEGQALGEVVRAKDRRTGPGPSYHWSFGGPIRGHEGNKYGAKTC